MWRPFARRLRSTACADPAIAEIVLRINRPGIEGKRLESTFQRVSGNGEGGPFPTVRSEYYSLVRQKRLREDPVSLKRLPFWLQCYIFFHP